MFVILLSFIYSKIWIDTTIKINITITNTYGSYLTKLMQLMRRVHVSEPFVNVTEQQPGVLPGRNGMKSIITIHPNTADAQNWKYTSNNS